MKNKQELAILFSGGDFEEVTSLLAEDIVWNIYEDYETITGKEAALAFCRQIADYFASVTTRFELYGTLEEANKVAVYGKATFIREGKTVNIVHSCDLYEFSQDGLIAQVHSYCNSNRPAR